MEERIDALKEGAKPFRGEVLAAVIEATLRHDQELVGSRVDKLRQGLASLLTHPHMVSSATTPYQLRMFASASGLPSREQGILELIAEGKSEKRIASDGNKNWYVKPRSRLACYRMKGINTPRTGYLTLLSRHSLGNGPMVMLLPLSLRWVMNAHQILRKSYS